MCSSDLENEGKVFMYQFGKKIFDKLNDLMNPTFEDEDPTNPFDLWEGANFRLKIRQFEGYPNYDKSEFDPATPLSEDDAELERIWGEQHPLQELVSESNFKSYTELRTKLYRVLDLQNDAPTASAPVTETADELDLSSMSSYSSEPRMATAEPSVGLSASDDDDDLSIFKELARS